MLCGNFTVATYEFWNVNDIAPAPKGERCREKGGREVGRNQGGGKNRRKMVHWIINKYCRWPGIPIATIATLHVWYVEKIPGTN